MDEQTASVLAKNLWELEQRVASGHVDLDTRRALLKASKHQLDYLESRQGILEERRSFIKMQDDLGTGVLVVHGSTGHPADLRDLASRCFGAGCTVLGVRLPEHGPDRPNLSRLSWRAALAQVEERYRLLANCCDRVVVLGLSFGAALALQLELKPRPHGLVLIAPALFPKLFWWQSLLVRLGFSRLPWLRARFGWDAELLEAMEAARQQSWWHAVPVYAAMAGDDTRVDPTGLEFLKRRATHRDSQFELIEQGGHMVHLSPAQERIEAEVVEFLGKLKAPAKGRVRDEAARA